MSEISSDWKLSAIKQGFSLPEALVFYMSQNPPSPEVFHKLIRCCKYFWLKNRVISLNSLSCIHDINCWEILKINGSQFQKFQKFKIENFNERLWIHLSLTVFDEGNLLAAASLIPRIDRCDLTFLKLCYQSLTFDEFLKFTLSGSLEELKLDKTIVKNDDGTIVPIEKLIEMFPKLQRFRYLNLPRNEGLQTITSETAANLVAVPHFPKIKIFSLHEIPESFDFEAFFATSKVNTFFGCLINCLIN